MKDLFESHFTYWNPWIALVRLFAHLRLITLRRLLTLLHIPLLFPLLIPLPKSLAYQKIGIPIESVLFHDEMFSSQLYEMEKTTDLSYDTSSKVEFTCARHKVWLEGEDLYLGQSSSCGQGFSFSKREGHQEVLKFSLSLTQSKADQNIIDTFGFSESSVQALVKLRVLPWLKTSLVYHKDVPAGEGSKPYRFAALYASTSQQNEVPFDTTLGIEKDDQSSLKIGFIKKNIGNQRDQVSSTLYGGGLQYDQTFHSGVSRVDNRFFGALQLNLNQLDQSIILGLGKGSGGGPYSQLIGFNGSIMDNKENEWTTVCRIRRALDSQNIVRSTEFCLVEISIGNRNNSRGRYIDFLGIFVPGIVKPTRLVNGNIFNESDNVTPTSLITDRPLWQFIATGTNVEITDHSKLIVGSIEFYRSFQEQIGEIHDPFVGMLYSWNNNLYFNPKVYELNNTKITKILSLAFGGSFGPQKEPWATEFLFGWDLNHNEPNIQIILEKKFTN